MSTYVITGAAGFIGSHLVQYLLDLNERVIGVDNFSNGKKENLSFVDSHPNASQFSFVELDVRDAQGCKDVCQSADYVLHQAAMGSVPRSLEYPELYHENNATGTLNMLVAARDANVKRFVFASSSSVYGDTPVLPKVETMIPRPKSPYAVGKLMGEYYCKVFYENYGLSTVALRYFNVFGPRQDPLSQYAAVVPKFVMGCLANEPPVIYGDGTQTRDFTYVENVIRANLNACTAKESAFGEAFNVGCGDRISLNDLAKMIKELTGSSFEFQYQSQRKGDVKDSLASVEKSKRLLNMKELIQLKEGLLKTVEWYKMEVGVR